jgi:hypothetical protein
MSGSFYDCAITRQPIYALQYCAVNIKFGLI